ncbi:MAG: hypothetical protein IJ875_01460 [Solobacterium sp.]|nr:hypothetical protein [Solobacterium sp.]
MLEKNEWFAYIDAKKEVYGDILDRNLANHLISEANWVVRSQCGSGEDMGIDVEPGDICFTDFGTSYLNEAGYQHFSIMMSVYQKKALVIPMTSNHKTYEKAYDPLENPLGKKNLMRIGLIHGLVKPSVLFLNDLRYINTARVIRKTTHISKRSALFKEIQKRVREVIALGE